MERELGVSTAVVAVVPRDVVRRWTQQCLLHSWT